MTWSQQAWAIAEPTYRAICEMPFVKALADGTLSRQRFEYYLEQDALYLANYSKVLANIASRLDNNDDAARFMRFALDGVEVERTMHRTFLGGSVPSADKMSPTCLLYTSVLAAQATRPVQIQAAAILPCFWIYQRVGMDIVKHSSADNPYRQWIDTYSDPGFETATKLAIDICDKLADSASADIRADMTHIFALCTRLEWMFWDAAWNLEKWKI